MGIAALKFELLIFGSRLPKRTCRALCELRHPDLTIRDGIAGGLDIRLFNDVFINVPIKESLALLSPFSIEVDTGGQFLLAHRGEPYMPITVLPQPTYVGKTTARGTPYEEVGQLFTDRLGIAPFLSCRNARDEGTACRFCEIGNGSSRPPLHPDDIREVMQWCSAHPEIGMRHVLISGGSPPKKSWGTYLSLVELVCSSSKGPVYVMIEPPSDSSHLRALKALGVRELGMNLEVFDRSLAKLLMPGKGKLSLSLYRAAFTEAVRLWGRDGAVRSILIAGLEPPESTLSGVEELCRLGVMPILSPFRPIPGTPLQFYSPPSPQMLVDIWMKAQAICESEGMTLGPTCICCQNNTITLPVNNSYRLY
jgi:hypothetical protein